MLSETPSVDERSVADSPLKTAGKTRLLTLDSLDGRTLAARYARATRAEVVADLGGEANLSSLECILVDSVVLTAAMLNDAGARWLKGEEIDVATLSTLTNTFHRAAASLGWQRRSKDITPPSLREYASAAYGERTAP